MKAEELRRSVLQLAVEGKLVEQRPGEGTARELLAEIAAERERLVREGKMKKGKPLAPVSPDEVPFEIPESWEWVRLGDIAEINPRNKLDDSLEVSFVPMTLIAEGYQNSHRSEVRLWKSVKSGFTHFRDNDIGVAKITPCFQNKKSVIFHDLKNGYGAGTTELHILRISSNSVIREFILWFVKNPIFIHEGVAHFTGTAGQERISKDFLLNYPLPLPPLAEQRRIVARLEELMPLIDAYDAEERRLSALETEFPEQLRRSLLQYAVEGKLVEQRPEEGTARELLAEIAAERERLIREGKMKRSKPLAPVSPDEVPFEIPKSWEWVRLGDLVSKIGSGSTPTGGKAIYLKTGIPFIRSQNVYNDGLRLDDVAYISAEINLKMSGTVVHPKDILLNITGASIGRCALVPDNFVQGNVNQHVLILRPVLTDVREYLHRYITSPVFQNRIMDEQIGVSREGISAEKLKKFIIPLPPLAEQRRIVARLEELMPLITTLTSIKKPLL